MTYVTEIYCENLDCNVRECQILTKDIGVPDPPIWRCPGCGKRAKIHLRRLEHEPAGEVKAAQV